MARAVTFEKKSEQSELCSDVVDDNGLEPLTLRTSK